MTVGELTKYLEDWAPPGVAWERDNPGLQVGSKKVQIKNIMLCLELNDEVLREAVKKKCNFIFTHHPLIFKPLKKIDIQNDPLSKSIHFALKNNITVYSSHTNLDFTADGVSFELAKTLTLEKISFLKEASGNQFKITLFVPEINLDAVADAVFNAGAGIIGEYKNCSFSTRGTGTFKGSSKSNPAVGKKNNFEKVEEIRFEFIVDSWKLNQVIAALKNAHPYEEPAFDVIPLKNVNVNFGAGAAGELNKKLSEKDFLSLVSRALKTKVLKYSSGQSKFISKVAVCGGSGSDLLDAAISSGADAFITADIKYHSYQDAAGKILLIDAGHYETEIMGLNPVLKRIKKILPEGSGIKVFKFSGNTNPVKFYKQ